MLEELSPAAAAALAASGRCVRTRELLGGGSHAAELVLPGAPASWLPERWVALRIQSSCDSAAVLRVQARHTLQRPPFCISSDLAVSRACALTHAPVQSWGRAALPGNNDSPVGFFHLHSMTTVLLVSSR